MKFTVILKVVKPDDSDAGDLYMFQVEASGAGSAEAAAWEDYAREHELTFEDAEEYEYSAPFVFHGWHDNAEE